MCNSATYIESDTYNNEINSIIITWTANFNMQADLFKI